MLAAAELRKISAAEDSFPFNLPLVRNFQRMAFENPVTFFVGENGSGKSTILEAIAIAAGLPTLGSTDSAIDDTMSQVRNLADKLTLSWKIRTHRGFFLRAEDFFGFVKRVAQLKSERKDQKKDAEARFTGYGRRLAAGSAQGQLYLLEKRFCPG